MSIAMPLPDYISQTSSGLYKNRVLRTQFGDGYEQSTVDGINATLGAWTILYENLNELEFREVLLALDTVGSWDIIRWQSPAETIMKSWKMTDDGVTINAKSGEIYDLSFSIRQVPG